MKIRPTTIEIALCFALVLPVGSGAADTVDDAPKAEKVAKKQARMPMFTPTNVGSPKTRLGGATRGAHDELPRTEALVPEETGQTLVAQPVLYWYLSEPTGHRIDFTLIGVDPINPILETTLTGKFEPGVQKIRLSDHGVELESGVSYQWFLAVVPNPAQRLYDRIVGGGIERLETSSDLQAKLASAPASDSHFVLAEAGVWYDAFDALNDRIASSPGDATLIAQRAAMLDQVGLGKIN